MQALRRVLVLAGLIAGTVSTSGCSSMWHDLQPHRLHQLNRGPGMPTGPEAYSAVSGPHRPNV